MAIRCLLALSCLPALVVRLEAGPEALLVAPEGGAGATRLVSAAVRWDEVAAATGSALPARPLSVRANGTRGEALPCQFEPLEEGSVSGLVTVAVPPGDGGKVFRVTMVGGTATTRPSTLEVDQTDTGVTVRNAHYAITHDSQKQGGLPSRMEWMNTGKVFDSFQLNDRVYDKTLGAYWLHEDPSPEVALLAAGPLYAAVRVHARYMRDGKQPPSQPEATYTFRYFADSPVVHVTADIRQSTAFAWHELHFLEVNFPDQSFDRWAAGEPVSGGRFAAAAKGWSASRWGALVEGQSALGLFGCGGLKLYDGRGGYGTYLHGPWIKWSTAKQSFRASLWLGATEEAARDIGQAAAAGSFPLQGYVTVAPLRRAFTSLQQLAEGEQGTGGSTLAWVIDRVRQQAHQQGQLAAALSQANELLSRVRAESPAAAVNWYRDNCPGTAILQSEQLLAAFDAQTLAVTSLYDLRTRRELLAAEQPPLWELSLVAGERTASLTALTAGAERSLTADRGEASEVALRWRFRDEPGPVTVMSTARLSTAGMRLSFAVDNASEQWSLAEIAFPQVAVGSLGASPEDDVVLAPRGSGEFRKAPLLNPYRFGGRYPSGWVSMQFAALYDPEGGLYFAAEDPVASTKDLEVETTADQQAVAMRIRWPAPDSGRPGNDWRLPGAAALRLTAGHWFDVAQVYRRWVSSEAQWWPTDPARGDTPEWFKEVALWACTSGPPENCVEPVKKLAALAGVPTAFHWYSWHQIPFDVEYPHYFPTKPGMPEGVKELQSAGVRVMPYINGRLWDTALEDFKEEAHKYCTKDPTGQPYIEVYGSGAKLAPMCPATPFWQQKVQEIVGRLTGPETGVEAVYLDQIAAARPRLCYDPTHGHPLGGGHWWTTEGYWPMLRDLRRQLPAGKALTSECNAEPYLHLLDGLLTWHFQYQDQLPLFAAVYGGRVQLFSRAYRGNDQVAHRMKAGQSLVFGEQIGWLNPSVMLDNEETGRFLRRMAQLRYQLRDFLARGRLARPPTLEGDIPDLTADWAWHGKWPVTTSALQAAAWQATEGRLAFLFVNVSDAEVRCRWTYRNSDYGLPNSESRRLLSMAGHALLATGAKFTRDLAVPAREATVLLVER